MSATITYRKTRQGEWVACGPAAIVRPHQLIDVTRRDGTTRPERVVSVGRVFQAGGQDMVYGYLDRTRHGLPASRTAAMCDQCGERRAVTTASDMSGIPGQVCGICARSGGLSFA